ncbi:MAG: MFS transporter [Bacteroidota bacterium]
MEATKATVSKRIALFATTLSSFLTTFIVSANNIAIKSIATEFSMDAVKLNWVSLAYLITAAIFLVPIGKIADIFGRKKIYLIGLISFSLASLFAAIATNDNILIIFRALQGIGAAMIFGTAIAILSSVFPQNERGKVLGYNLAATYLGLSSGPFIGGFMVQQLGWRSIYFAGFLFSLIIFPLVIYKLKAEWHEAKGEKLDIKGSIIYMIGMFGIIYGFSTLPDIKGIILLTAGIIITILFLKLQQQTTFPVLDLSNFKKNTVFIFSNLAAFINYSATFAVGYLLSMYLQYIKGLTPQQTGIILITQPLTMAIFSPLAGRLSDKIEPQLVATIGMGLTLLGLIPFIFLSYNTSTAYITATLFLIGIGFSLFSSPNTNAIMSSVERKYYGVASASVGTMRLTGQAISMGIATLVFTIYIGKVKITPEYYPQFLNSTHTAFIIFAVLCTLGTFASLARGKLR